MVIDFFSDAQQELEFKKGSDEALNTLARYVSAVQELDRKIADLEEHLSVLKKEREDFIEIKIPEIMEQYGFSTITLKNGQKLSVVREVFCSVVKNNQTEAYDWLRQNGHGSLIKHELKTSFSRGEDQKAKEAKTLLLKNGFDVDDSETVHWQTLRAFAREQIEAGNNLPEDLFNVHIKNVAKIK